MWKFSDLNSTCNLWPPESRQQQPKFIGCFSRNGDNPFPSFGVQGSSLHLNSDFISPPNLQAFNPANSSSGLGVTTPTKRYLVFDHSGDKRNLMFCYMEIPFQTLNPTLPASNATYALTSNYQEEMHEDTEEIDALLYSDSEFSFDSEEDSTAHSPLDMEEEEVASSPIPAKRRRLDLSVSDLDVSLMDTASSARAPSSQLPGDEQVWEAGEDPNYHKYTAEDDPWGEGHGRSLRASRSHSLSRSLRASRSHSLSQVTQASSECTGCYYCKRDW